MFVSDTGLLKKDFLKKDLEFASVVDDARRRRSDKPIISSTMRISVELLKYN